MELIKLKNKNCKIKFNSLTNSVLSIVCSFLFLVTVLGLTDKEQGTPSWARFCGVDKDGQSLTQDVFSDKCRAGAWFGKSEVKWKCICTMGAWALRFSWCGSEKPIQGFGSSGFARFTTPELSCFRIAQDVTNGQVLEGILSLGKWSNRYKEGAPLIWTKATGGTVLTRRDLIQTKVKQLPLVANVSTIYALRSLPRPGTYWSIICHETNTAVCLQPPSPNDANGTLFSYEISHLWTRKGSRSRVKLNFDMQPGCDVQKFAGHSWLQVRPKSLSPYVLPKLNLANLHDDCSACLGSGSPYDPPTTTEKCFPKDADNLTALANEVDLQSERLAEHLGQKILMNKTGAMIIQNIPEMAFLTKGAMMAFGACNMNYIPKQFYQFFLILVEALLSESYVKYPPNPLAKDKYDDILKILDTCMASTEPFKIYADNSCPPIYDTYEVPGQKNLLKADIFVEIMADPKKHDYIVEFIFKIVSFIHYHCYPFFKEAPFLHDVLQVQMESIFRDDLLMRWAYPSNSFAMLQQLFKIHFDLKVTMENFEKCVVITHNINNYKGVLKKPINQPAAQLDLNKKRRKRRAIKEKTFVRRQKHLDVEAFDLAVNSIEKSQPSVSKGKGKLNGRYKSNNKKSRKRALDFDSGLNHGVVEGPNKIRYSRNSGSGNVIIGFPDEKLGSSHSTNKPGPYLDFPDKQSSNDVTWPSNSEADTTESSKDVFLDWQDEKLQLIGWPQDADKYDEDSFLANNETGQFKGDANFACLESLPEFSEFNPQYDLYGKKCWNYESEDLQVPKYLDL